MVGIIAAVVVQIAEEVRRAFQTWNRTQVLVDRVQLVVRHVVKYWPRHHSGKVAVDR